MDKRRFSKEANIQYTYPSAEQLVNNTDDLLNFINHHQNKQQPRLKELREYYEGNNTKILRGKRRREEHLADHRAANAFAEYVSGFIQGYMVGIPIKTEYSDDEETNDLIRDINRTNDADEHNSNLVLDQSIYGRAYELLYRNQNDETRFTVSDVLQTFVIYDTTVEQNPIAGVRYFVNQFKNNEQTVFLYTEKAIHQYVVDESGKLREENIDSHAFEGVPIIEYSNNRFRLGDFERVLDLIDLYDESQSDTANYMTDFNDAMLKIIGDLDIDVEQAQKMKEHNVLMLQTRMNSDGKTGQAQADYIYKKYDVQGTEAYKDRVKNDIHMFTHTPNMDDEHFASNQSGEALKYKLFGLEQKRATKERLFKKSLRDRYRLIHNMMKMAAEGEFDVNKIKITFTPNLPKSLKDEIEAFVKLGGELSEQTVLSLLSTLVENPQEEMERKEQESQKRREQSDRRVLFDLNRNRNRQIAENEVTGDE
ncbi:phage portal protein [Halalkalibacterium halodurans]|uniref:phage portal protein n=1 Tax=Halalkalibacterium halodurans TaxID=86665 RepID=UPI002E1A202D|nr:phage portal protein [Halalkalibacterium halodurans]MED4083878.1 phage portal protein [Halalkalibacterium halodurans]MED4105515.1 phage portal protein [Halalkalibacterium halodurans]MED4109279.1 phage portal protein [Halalkalibacterium halodurans]MED4149707.1 phage portal protein [Halalkalibacterium halodurans]